MKTFKVIHQHMTGIDVILKCSLFNQFLVYDSGGEICTEQIMSAAIAGSPEEQLISGLKGSFA